RPCYKIAYFHDVSSRVAFNEAHQACEMDGGALLSIESATEQRDIEHLLQVRLTPGGGGIADGDFWIGLTRADGVDQTPSELSNAFTSCPKLYQWTDGSVASFRNWYFDEPSCGGEACVVMYHQPTAPSGLGGAYLYQWNDDRCNMKHNFICKYEPESHLVKEHGDTPGGRDTGELEGPYKVRVPGMLLLYIVIPTIPLLLLILVASATCCFQMLSRSMLLCCSFLCHYNEPNSVNELIYSSQRSTRLSVRTMFTVKLSLRLCGHISALRGCFCPKSIFLPKGGLLSQTMFLP
uniref:Chondrolectin n=1 Tax=Amphilophus citrinellus TaxID=61819 RepID=A0A3Q0RR34_AMPCI